MRCQLLSIVLALSALCLIPPAPLTRAQVAAPAFAGQGQIGGVSEVKFPRVATTPSQVHVAANINRATASLWSKAATAPDFGAPTTLGVAEGQPDYSTASLAVGPDGAIVVAWVNQPQRTIFMRRRPAGQDWGAPVVVADRQPFPVFPTVIVGADGAITVAWRNPDRPFVFRRSTTDGAGWGPITNLSERAGLNQAALAAGPDGALAAAYTQAFGDRLQVVAAIWNGASFTPQRVTDLNGDYADPSLSYAPDGRLYVAWRGVAESGGASGVFYAEQQPDGTWPPARLIGGKVAGVVSIAADQAGNLHMLWTAGVRDTYQLWYAVKPAAGPWSSPVAAPDAGGLIFNAALAVAPGADGQIYAHAVSEAFAGRGIALRFYRFSAGLPIAPSARPVLEGDAPRSQATHLDLSFSDVQGGPAEVRVRWGAPPTGAEPWRPFGPMIIPAPDVGDRCASHTLYTQVRGSGGVQQAASHDAIVLDRAVQAQIAPAATTGAPGYTSTGTAAWQIADIGECSGFGPVRLSGSAPALTGPPEPIAFDLPAAEGAYERTITVSDRLGNTATVTATFVHDRTPPAVSAAGALSVSADPAASVVQTLTLAGAVYRDAGSPLPWAVAVLASRAPISALPQTNPPWRIIPLRPGDLTSAATPAGYTIRTQVEVSLAALVENPTPGTYHYALALVDRAGNLAATAAIGRITLDTITLVQRHLPLVRHEAGPAMDDHRSAISSHHRARRLTQGGAFRTTLPRI